MNWWKIARVAGKVALEIGVKNPTKKAVIRKLEEELDKLAVPHDTPMSDEAKAKPSNIDHEETLP